MINKYCLVSGTCVYFSRAQEAVKHGGLLPAILRRNLACPSATLKLGASSMLHSSPAPQVGQFCPHHVLVA
jgi:hypothetical protein